MFTVAAEEDYEKGGVIFEEGSSGKWAYIVLSGTVEISRKRHGGKILIRTLKNGEIFGELAFILGKKRSATATALENSRIGILDREHLEKEYNQLSGDLRTLIETLAGRLHQTLDRLSALGDRAASRYPKVLTLSFRDRAAFVQAYTRNLSTGGLFIKTGTPLPEGHRFMLKLQIPDTPELLQIESEVAWISTAATAAPGKPPGMGIRFVSLSPGHEKLLAGCLAETGDP